MTLFLLFAVAISVLGVFGLVVYCVRLFSNTSKKIPEVAKIPIWKR
jgi:hypothetical protein